MTVSCQFCLLNRDGSSRHFANVMRNSDFDEIIYAGREIMLIPDVAPCATGHMLIVAREHHRALLKFWAGDEVTEVIAAVDACLPEDQKLVIFEHGIVADNAKPSCVEHAHAHLIPMNKSLKVELQEEIGDLDPINSPRELLIKNASMEYAILRDIDEQWYQASLDVIPGQAIRRAILGSSANIHWNWLDYVEFAEPLNTRNKIVQGAVLFDVVRKVLNDQRADDDTSHIEASD